MKKHYVSNASESTRMFKSNFLESLSKIPFYGPLIVYIPLIGFLSWKSLVQIDQGLLEFSIWILAGLAIWTITEYFLHRYVFHYQLPGAFGERIHFIFHGVHHDYPNDAKRLVMPPSASIPLAGLFYLLFDWLLPEGKVYTFFSGFILGYLFYDMVHYALHHASFKKEGFWKRLKKNHMLHHYEDSTKGYGVSWMFWDHVFHTRPKTRR